MLVFGAWAPGFCGDIRTVTLFNDSDMDLNISGVRSAHFRTPDRLFSGPVAAHTGQPVEVAFISDQGVAATYDESVQVPMSIRNPDGPGAPLAPAVFRVYAVTDAGSPCPSEVCSDAGVCAGPPQCQCDIMTILSDDIFTAYCVQGAATPDAGCDDRNPCTTNDRCTSFPGECIGTPGPQGPCDDGSGCTENDTCQANGQCTGTAVACVTPPSLCADDTHQWVYSYPGTCVSPSGFCAYNQTGVVSCLNGCDTDAGACR